MTKWEATHCDILDCDADALICSANPNLNLSGGVGGAFALRYGESMQMFLHEHLRSHGLRNIEPGNVVITTGCGSPFQAVAHAVSIDAFYDTNIETILHTYDDAITKLTQQGCQTIVAACLGCGYGRVTPASFADVAKELCTRQYAGATQITLVSTNDELVNTIRDVLANASD